MIHSIKHTTSRLLENFIRIAIFLLSFILVVIFVTELDAFVGSQRLYFLRTGNWDELLTITLFAILVAYVLKRLLILQFKWGFKR